MKFIVFGLGSFGSSLASKLVVLGHEVIGVDHRPEVADKWKDKITHTVSLDATSREAMESLPLRDVDAVVVSIGETPGISIMVTALLKQLGVKRIINRVVTPLQRTVLEAMMIEEFINPEAESAERLAYKLDLKGVVDSYRVTDENQVIEVRVPKLFIGSKVGQIKFEEEHEILLVTVIRPSEQKNLFGTVHKVRKSLGIVDPELVLEKDDTLVLFGEVDKLEVFIEY
ncbi:MAG: TrkA family potassium uptake protein [Cyclobacteriaceae bacterium]